MGDSAWRHFSKHHVVFFVCLISLLSWTSIEAQVDSNYDSLVQQGNAQLQTFNNEQALASATSAIKVNSGRWEAYAVAGGALLNLKRYEEAVDQFSHAIDRAPESKQEGLRTLRKQCLSAESAGAQSGAQSSSRAPATATTQAEIVLWKSIENSSRRSDFEAYLSQYPNGAFAVLANNHVAEIKAKDDAATHPDISNLLRAGKVDEAVAALNRELVPLDEAIAKDPSSPEPYYQKAKLLVSASQVNKKGQLIVPPACIEAYKKYLKLAPDGPHAAEVEQTLAGLRPQAQRH